MFTNFIAENLTICIPAIVSLVLIAKIIRNRYGYGISQIPGPFLATITDLWRFVVVWGRRPDRTHLQLHRKYGSLVRLGPNEVSCSDPSALQVIYALNAGLIKSDF
jgi:hypothetical protein